jgi:antitoxin (DNA-binding transcriptional repressor) of toxin-antitoxin stability system
MTLTIEEVKRDLEKVLSRVLKGETVVVTDDDQPVAEIRPVVMVRRPRPFGLVRGTFSVPDDFDAPLPEEVLRDFER